MIDVLSLLSKGSVLIAPPKIREPKGWYANKAGIDLFAYNVWHHMVSVPYKCMDELILFGDALQRLDQASKSLPPSFAPSWAPKMAADVWEELWGIAIAVAFYHDLMVELLALIPAFAEATSCPGVTPSMVQSSRTLIKAKARQLASADQLCPVYLCPRVRISMSQIDGDSQTASLETEVLSITCQRPLQMDALTGSFRALLPKGLLWDVLVASLIACVRFETSSVGLSIHTAAFESTATRTTSGHGLLGTKSGVNVIMAPSGFGKTFLADRMKAYAKNGIVVLKYNEPEYASMARTRQLLERASAEMSAGRDVVIDSFRLTALDAGGGLRKSGFSTGFDFVINVLSALAVATGTTASVIVNPILKDEATIKLFMESLDGGSCSITLLMGPECGYEVFRIQRPARISSDKAAALMSSLIAGGLKKADGKTPKYYAPTPIPGGSVTLVSDSTGQSMDTATIVKNLISVKGDSNDVVLLKGDINNNTLVEIV